MVDRKHDAIGYKRPPSRTRFRPGHSGNPGGRPKRKPTFRAALLEELAATMPGKNPQRTGSKLRALVKTLVDTAIAGDARAQSLLIGALARMGDAEENEAASLTADDREILDTYAGNEPEHQASEADAATSPGDDHVN